MADSEDDYSSSDDSDYVPDVAVSDSDSGQDDQDENGEAIESKGKGKKIKKDASIKRKRKGGIKLEGEDVDGEECLDEEQEQTELEEERKALAEEERKAKAEEEQEREKQKADELWKSLLSDVGPRPKATSSTTNGSKMKTNSSASLDIKDTSTKEVAPGRKGDAATSSQKTVTITKVFDFAGEEVKVTKAVKADSQEAKVLTTKPAEATKASIGQLPLGGKRKPGGVSSVLGKINKKPKISVLEKSKLDWDSFKSKEGIVEELKIHNKGKEGFLQKQDFLMETDLRQYEIERKMRMGQSGGR
ncbi:craniofacial development protein 1-like isoform X2 [Apostichopus japonicus]|uniref:craniofacial development protein 1-like isoform X2 n=1 Tax=Stichopus japonicus TaxID=307972 RepID=UPI003AB82F84